jgi:hypothetical protein
MSKPGDWITQRAVNRVVEMWNAKNKDGTNTYSTSAIGKAIGISKNAVVGWAGRNEQYCPARPSPIRRDPDKPKTVPSAKRMKAVVTLPPLASLADPPVVIRTPIIAGPVIREKVKAETPAPKVNIDRPCCYVIDDSIRFKVVYCDAPSQVGSPYCPDHHQSCYAKKPTRAPAKDKYAWADATV